MKSLAFILLQAAGAAAPAAEGAAQRPGSSWSMWVMLALIFVVMYFFMIRPQRKQQKELETFRASLKKGDKVVTTGGIYGTVDEVTDRTILIKVDGDVKLRMDKNSILKDYSSVQ